MRRSAPPPLPPLLSPFPSSTARRRPRGSAGQRHMRLFGGLTPQLSPSLSSMARRRPSGSGAIARIYGRWQVGPPRPPSTVTATADIAASRPFEVNGKALIRSSVGLSPRYDAMASATLLSPGGGIHLAGSKQSSAAIVVINHIINSAAKSNYISAGQISVPIVFRGPNGAAAGVGAQHLQFYAAWYAMFPD